MEMPTILCIDDDEHDRTTVLRVARNRARVLIATRTDEALDIIRERARGGHWVDLVHQDVRRPRSDGIDFLRSLRTMDADIVCGRALRARHIPVVVLSGCMGGDAFERIRAIDPTVHCGQKTIDRAAIISPWWPALRRWRRRILDSLPTGARTASGIIETALCVGTPDDILAACARLAVIAGSTSDKAACGTLACQRPSTSVE